MGFLDRLRGADRDEPDATTKEVAACVKASESVSGAKAVTRDGVEVQWLHAPRSVLDIGPLRTELADRRGMDRIELLDTFVKGLVPPVAPVAVVDEPVLSDADNWTDIATLVLPAVIRNKDLPTDAATAESVGSLLTATISVGSEPVTTVQMHGWGQTVDELWSAAQTNMRAGAIKLEPIAPGRAAWIIAAPLGHQSAWLTNPDEILHELHLHKAVVFAPTPTDVLVVDAASPELLTTITGDTLTIFENGDGTLCPVPLVITHTEVTEWEPSADHPCAELVDKARKYI